MGKFKELALEEDQRRASRFSVVVQKEGKVVEVVKDQALFNVFSMANNLGLKGEVITAVGQEMAPDGSQITFWVK